MPNFDAWSRKRLLAEAKRLGLPGYSRMSNAQLIDALEEAWS